MHSFFHTLAHHCSAIAMILILLVTSVDINCFNIDFYTNQYEQLHTAQRLRLSEEDLTQATTVLLDYLRSDRDDCNVTITQNEEVKEAFNEKEKTHMVDVRNLYEFALNLRLISIIVVVVSLLYLWLYDKHIPWFALSSAFVKISVLFLMFFAFLGIWAYVDFNAFWTMFHEVCFTNDLWLLNPATDLMINLFPSPVFSALVFKILFSFLCPFIGLFIGAIVYMKKKLKGGSSNETYSS